jgi:phage tail sheath protein FI
MPIEGVGTAVAAFVGFTEKYDPSEGDPTDPTGVQPQLVTSWPQYERIYGGFVKGALLPFAVRGFFENGGSTCYVVRVPTGSNGQRPMLELSAAGRPDVESMRVHALNDESRLEIEVVPPPATVEGQAPSEDYVLRVYANGSMKEELTGLNFTKSPRTLERTLNEQSQYIRVEVKNVQGMPLAERAPAPGRYRVEAPPPTAIAVSPQDLEGSESERTGYQGLAISENVTIVAIPELLTVATREDGTLDEDTYLAFQGQLADWCDKSRSRIAILDPPPGLNATRALQWRERLARDSAFGVCYYPNVIVTNPLTRPGATNGERFITVPPSGHIAGLWARTDAARGVWKAPANEVIRGITRLEVSVTDGEQGELNPAGVNCIRSFGLSGIRVWGARTLAKTDPSWRYINVRRLFNYIEESIRRGTRWAVFEPNDQDLRERVKRNISVFLRDLWRQGAVVGATPEQAFYVLCDETNNPASSVDAGKLIVEVGVAPVKPAEFVIFRISQWQGGGATSE